MTLPLFYNGRSVRARWRLAALAVLAIGLVVAVAEIVMSIAEGLASALRSSGRTDNAIIVRVGSPSELMSYVPLDDRKTILSDERVLQRPGGALASWERVMTLSLARRSDGRRTNVTFRGVSPGAFDVRGDVRLISGRRFTPGLNEVIVGRRIVGRVRGLDLGATIRYRGASFKVVGVFESGGAAFESEVWGDFDTLAALFRLGPGSNSLVVRMRDPSRLQDLDRWLRAQPRMQLRAAAQRQYYEAQAAPLVTPLRALAALIGLVMGVGAVFGVMNTMYAIVAMRRREIGTLRALGFSRRAILMSFVIESALLAVIGGVTGCLAAATLQGHAAGAANLQSLNEVAFAFQLTPELVAWGLLLALVMGVLGALLPAWHAAHLPIADALRRG